MSQLDDLIEAYRALDRAISIETRHGFINIRGREKTFHEFVLATLQKHLPGFPAKDTPEFQRLTTHWQAYAFDTPGERTARVKQLKQLLKKAVDHFNGPQPTPADPGKEVTTPANGGSPLDLPVATLPKVGPRMHELLANLGIHTINDLLRHFPRTYYDYSQRQPISHLLEGQLATIVARTKRLHAHLPPGKPVGILKLSVQDSTGTATLFWFTGKKRFHAMQAQLERLYPPGTEVLVSGGVKWDHYSNCPQIDQPQVEILSHTGAESDTPASLHAGRVIPIYALTAGVSLRYLRTLVHEALTRHGDQVADPLALAPNLPPHPLTTMPLATALRQIHFPDSLEAAEAARQRLAFEELFLFQCRLAWMRQQYQGGHTRPPYVLKPGGLVAQFTQQLPFTLTGAQQRAFQEIVNDLHRPDPMYRLLQGDVGSGKTVVAALAMLAAVENGRQAVIMAPTEILAEQHHRKLSEWLTPLGLRVGLLLGKLRVKTRREEQQLAASGQSHVLVGTHALISEGVTFHHLGLVVIDEQHRFGVKQRGALLEKGDRPDLLSMTATPIPRTLSMTMHGDLDVSILDERPPGRHPIDTRLVTGARQLKTAYEQIRGELFAGRQAYVVLPLIEEKADAEPTAKQLKTAVAEAKRLQEEVFPEYRVGLLHGRLHADEKQAVMDQFLKRELHVLVSTTVIEVGVDVPNATMMLIEHAERFGLAQLHQLRGRVGRGAHQSTCYLATDSRTPDALERLQVMVDSDDGFYIAEKDMALRGPGEVFGVQQSGLPTFQLADLVLDKDLVAETRQLAQSWLAATPSAYQHTAFWNLVFARTAESFKILTAG